MNAALWFVPFALSVSARGEAQPPPLPATHLRYRIEARLMPSTRTVTATETLTWRSQAEVAVTHVPLHLYLNAFSHEHSTWLGEGLGAFGFDAEKFASRYDDPWGFVRIDSIQQHRHPDGPVEPCPVRYIQPDDGNPLDQTLMRVELPSPVEPGSELVLHITFTARLPIPIARTGGVDDYFHVAQWFPKLGVYETRGMHGSAQGEWAARQFHGPTEFYADFSDYDVTLTLPKEFVVVATGQGTQQKPTRTGHRSWRFRQRAVHDFAFVAGRNLHTETHPHSVGSHTVAVRYVTPKGTEHQVEAMRQSAETTLEVMTRRVGPYPFATLTVIQPPWRALRTAGMEYPTLVTGAPGDPLVDTPGLSRMRVREGTVAHEVIHNYFQGVVANDEQTDAWLDEGVTSFWTGEVMEALSTGRDWSALFGYPTDIRNRGRRCVDAAATEVTEAMSKQPSYLFYPGTRRAQIYCRGNVLLRTIRNLHGAQSVDNLFSEFFARYRFRHPDQADFLAVADEVTPPGVGLLLREALAARRPPDYEIVEATSEPWKSPLGRVPTGQTCRLVTPTDQEEATEEHIGLPETARETDGRVLVEIVSPGFVLGAGPDGTGQSQEGTVERRWMQPLPPSQGSGPDDDAIRASDEDWDARERDANDTFYSSEVMVRGPGWRHLPATLAFRFDDGVSIEDHWDGRATWRRYRFVRAARLTEAQIDPEDLLAIDQNVTNNGKWLQSDHRLANDFGLWITKVAQWLALGVATWL